MNVPWYHRNRPRPEALPPDREADPSGVEDVWRMLDNALGLVRHAELKAVTILATSGVLGQILMVVLQEPGSAFVTACSGLAGGFCVAAALSSVGVLWPRTSAGGERPSLLHFATVARIRGPVPVIYQQQLAELVRDRDELLAQVAEQIWANSIIARRKYRFANLAVISIITAAVALGCVFVMKI